MITKIASNEYLKRVDNMTAAEREEYLNRVGEWLKSQSVLLLPKKDDEVARFQDALQCSSGWNDAECLAWNEGARLLTALAGKEDTWLPDMLYVKAAKRAIGQMVAVLSNAKEEPVVQTEKVSKVAVAEPSQVSVAAPDKHSETFSAERVQESTETVAAVPVRPKHIDQYVHLLPKKTQERAAMVQGLMRELDAARENARLLMNDPKTKDDSRAQWAKAATTIDAKIKSIYKELDAEWDKLVKSGRVVVDDLGNARVLPEAGPSAAVAADENQATDDPKRRDYLKKWLRDTRTAASEERKKQWKENCMELLRLGGELTDSICKAADHYGVDLSELTKDSDKPQDKTKEDYPLFN